jgi:hypothetical protein
MTVYSTKHLRLSSSGKLQHSIHRSITVQSTKHQPTQFLLQAAAHNPSVDHCLQYQTSTDSVSTASYNTASISESLFKVPNINRLSSYCKLQHTIHRSMTVHNTKHQPTQFLLQATTQHPSVNHCSQYQTSTDSVPTASCSTQSIGR